MRHLAPIFAFLWVWLFALTADAASSAVHVDWKRGTSVYGGESVTSSGSSAHSGAAPSFDSGGTLGGVARITATHGASIVLVGHATPVATQTNGFYLTAGNVIELPVAPGDEVAIIAATDQRAPDAPRNGQNLPAGLPTYRLVVGGYAAYATPTDLLCIAAGPSKETVVTSAVLQIQSTSATLGLLDWVKRSAPDTGGTPTSLTLLPEDTAYPGGTPSATATVTEYGSAPTLGTSVGVFQTDALVTGTLTAAPAVFTLYSVLGNGNTTTFQGILVLHPGEAICANWRGNAIPSGFAAIITVALEEQ
jgi:hypothetical protein